MSDLNISENAAPAAPVKKRTEGGRILKASGPQITGTGDNKIGGAFELSVNPTFIQRRMDVYDRMLAKQQAQIEGKIRT